MFPSHEVLEATLQMRDWCRGRRDKTGELPSHEARVERIRKVWPQFKEREFLYIHEYGLPTKILSNFTEKQEGYWGSAGGHRHHFGSKV